MLRFLGVVFLVLLLAGGVFTDHGRFNTALLFFGSCAAIGLLILAHIISRAYRR